MQIVQKILPTADMIRAARGYLNWSQADLGERCDLSKVSLVGIESKRQHPNMQTMKRIASVFWDQGLTFLAEGGFSVDNQIIKIYEGLEGVAKFFEQVYITAREKGGEFLISGASAEFFIEMIKKSGFWEEYSSKMKKLFERKQVSYKAIISEKEKDENSDTFAEYINYKYLQDDKFGNVPFYIFGDNLAIFLWKENKMKIICIREQELVNAYKKTFGILWKNAELI